MICMRLAINRYFVSYIPPSNEIILAIHNALYGLCQIRSPDSGTYATKHQLNFGFNPLQWVKKSITSSIYYTSLRVFLDNVFKDKRSTGWPERTLPTLLELQNVVWLHVWRSSCRATVLFHSLMYHARVLRLQWELNQREVRQLYYSGRIETEAKVSRKVLETDFHFKTSNRGAKLALSLFQPVKDSCDSGLACWCC